MPAKHKVDIKAKLIITSWVGDASDKDFIDALTDYQIKFQNHPQYWDFNEVVDFSKMSNIKLTMEGLKKIGEIAARSDSSKFQRKLAIVVRSTRAYGIAKLYEAYRNISKKANKEVRAFINEKEAYEWVKIRP